jgi:Bacterial SH3 domain/Outer membrane protein beta-barrel domain
MQPRAGFTITLLLHAALLGACAPGVACAGAGYAVEIADPYLELHTGPGRGYPVFYVVDRGEEVVIEKRRTDWFKVRTDRGRTGWVHREQLLATLDPDGTPFELDEPTRENFASRRWEGGVMAGDFGGASVIALDAGYALNENFTVEAGVAHAIGDFSNSVFATLSLVHVFDPAWRISPYVSIGTGVIRTQPKSTLVATEDRTDQLAQVGIGVRAYLTRRFMVRTEYKSYVVFTSRDDNEEVDEWKAGFAFFF